MRDRKASETSITSSIFKWKKAGTNMNMDNTADNIPGSLAEKIFSDTHVNPRSHSIYVS